MYEMKEEYLTGIPMIDEEHSHLFELAEQTYQLLNDDMIPDKYDNIQAVLKELLAYAHKHFEDEEAYMESIQYKRMFTQKVQHQGFIEKIDSFDPEEIDENQTEAIQEILNFLTDWLIHHIMDNDKLIGKP